MKKIRNGAAMIFMFLFLLWSGVSCEGSEFSATLILKGDSVESVASRVARNTGSSSYEVFPYLSTSNGEGFSIFSFSEDVEKESLLSHEDVLYAEKLFRIERVQDTESDSSKSFAQVFQTSQEQNVPNDPFFTEGKTDHLSMTGFPEAWNIFTGKNNIVVGLLDTGVDPSHPDLKDNIHSSAGVVADDDGRGTHSAGILGAVGNNGRGTAGACWETSLFPVPLEHENGTASSIEIFRGLDKLLEAKSQGMDIRIALIQFGGWTDAISSFAGNSYAKALYSVYEKGILLVLPSGDEGQDLRNPGGAGTDPGNPDMSYTGLRYIPASAGNGFALVAGGMDSNGNLAEWSNRGPEDVHVAAPGTNIWSLSQKGSYVSRTGSGTSAALTAGLAALIWSREPNLSPGEVKRIILSSSVHSTGLDKKIATGGRIDAQGSLLSEGGDPVVGVALNQKRVTLPAGETLELIATVHPSTAADKKVSWTTSNSGTATVSSSGEVRARSKGNATISVFTNDGGFSSSCFITVTESIAPIPEPEEPDPDEEVGTGCSTTRANVGTVFLLFPLFMLIVNKYRKHIGIFFIALTILSTLTYTSEALDTVEGEYLVLFRNRSATEEIQKSTARYSVTSAGAESLDTFVFRTSSDKTTIGVQTASIHDEGYTVVHVKVPGRRKEEILEKLGQNPDFISVVPNLVFRLVEDDIPSFPSDGSSWGIYSIRAHEAWEYTKGSKDVIVAVMDTGIDVNHPALADSLATDLEGYHGINLLAAEGSPEVRDLTDRHGHGTHVSGIVGGKGTGVVPRASVLAVKFIMDEDKSTGNCLMRGLEYLLDQRQRGLGIRVLNCSFTAWYPKPKPNDPPSAYSVAMKALSDAGIVICAASGNDGTDIDNATGEYENKVPYPASLPGVPGLISVASFSGNGLAGDSNRGKTSVHVAAPGVNISSTVPGGGVDSWSGTSMASPHVAGTAALIASRYPNLGAAAIKRSIVDNVTKIDKFEDFIISGGVVNALESVVKGAGDATPETIRLNISKISLDRGNSINLFATVLPDNARDTEVIWKSSLISVASVTPEGRIDALSPGRSEITATTPDGAISSSCIVTVNSTNPPPPDTEEGGGCSLSQWNPLFLLLIALVPLQIKR